MMEGRYMGTLGRCEQPKDWGEAVQFVVKKVLLEKRGGCWAIVSGKNGLSWNRICDAELW